MVHVNREPSTLSHQPLTSHKEQFFMNMTVEGTVQEVLLGPGAWSLVTAQGETYELYQAPAKLLQPGLNVKVQGRVREDVMTIAMIGPVLEVLDFEIV